MLMYAFVEQGSMHRFMHHHAQDCAVSHRRGSVGGVAVSDGAGSKPLSADGAHIVAHDVIRHMVDHFDTLFQMDSEAVSCRLARLVLQRLRLRADALHAPIDHFASTLLAVCADARSKRFIAVHLGDGIIAARGEDGRVMPLSLPERGEGVSTFLTSCLALQPERLRVMRGTGLSGFMLMSDGAENSLYCAQGRTLSPSISGFFDALASCPMAFDAAFSQTVRTIIRPVDDFSACLLSLDPLSSPRLLSSSAYRPVDPTARRVAKAAIRYAASRDTGASPVQAARHAGWRKQDMPRRLAQMARIGVEPVFSKNLSENA